MPGTIRTLIACVLLGSLLAGCGTSPLVEGNQAFRNGDHQTAEAYWIPLAEEGDVGARHNLGVLEAHLGDIPAAADWWQQAVAQEFVPSMLALGKLKMATGQIEEAEALYRRAARWGNSEAVAALEALDKPVPRADLLKTYMRQLNARQARIAWELSRPDPNEDLNRMLDQQAAMAEND